MQITRLTDYAVRAVLHLAAHGSNGPVPAAEIAREQGIPLDYVPKVLQALSRADLVTTYAGRSGGAQLRRSAEEITVLDVVEAGQGPMALNRCLLRKGQCPRDVFCPVHAVWAAAQSDLKQRLRDTNIAGLVEGRTDYG